MLESSGGPVRFLLLLFVVGMPWMDRADAADLLRKYYVSSYPASKLGCAGEASALAERFARITAARVVERGCLKDWGKTYDLFVFYTAAPPPQLVSTAPSQLYSGTYPSAGACQNALPGEMGHFERATGLPILVAYCYRDPGVASLPYVVHIETFGTPLKKPYYDTWSNMLYRPMGDLDRLAAQIFERSVAGGLDAVQTVFRKEGNSTISLVTRYYASQLTPLSVEKMGYFKAIERCEQELSELTSIFERKAPGTLALFCALSDTLWDTELYWVRIENDTTMTKSVYRSDYPSLQACRADRDRVISLYVNELARPAFAALCEKGPDGYRMRVFEVYRL